MMAFTILLIACLSNVGFDGKWPTSTNVNVHNGIGQKQNFKAMAPTTPTRSTSGDCMVTSRRGNTSCIIHWGQPREATVVKMAPTRPLASRCFCLLALLCDHRSFSNLQQRNTGAWYTLHQNDRLVPFFVFVHWSSKDSPRDDGRQNWPK